MTKTKKDLRNKTIIGSLLLLLSFSTNSASAKLYCEDAQLWDAAWGFSQSAQTRFQKNYTEPRNANVSQSEKERRVLRVIHKYHRGIPGVISDQGLAKLIVWASDCGGHDFTYFTALVEQESHLCSVRLSTSGGGDSGCGQFTSPAINLLKNQLRLPGQQKNNDANRMAKKLMTDMLNKCASTYPLGKISASEWTQGFLNLFSSSKGHIRTVLRNGSQVSHDLVATSMMLKFLVARTGGYIIPGSSPGALTSYNGKSAYAKAVSGKAQRVALSCTDDSAELEIAASACLMSDNPDACLAEVEDMANEVIEL